MLKIPVISLVLRTRELTDIFNTMKYIWYWPKKSKYPLYDHCLRVLYEARCSVVIRWCVKLVALKVYVRKVIGKSNYCLLRLLADIDWLYVLVLTNNY